MFFAIYLLIVGGAAYSDIDAQWTMNKFDLNKDGFFSGDELTTVQEKAMRNLINDTGRNFSSIIGLFFSGIIALFVFICGYIMEYICKKKKNNMLTHEAI